MSDKHSYNPRPPSILMVHPNTELYGSDRTFIQSIRSVKDRWPNCHLSVALTGAGPISSEIARYANEIIVEDIFVLRKSHFGLHIILQLQKLVSRIIAARRSINSFDLVYLNTIVNLDYNFATRFSRTPVLIHVHEIPTGLSRLTFSLILKFARGHMIYNSRATEASYLFLKGRNSSVVWNGTQDCGIVSSRPAGSRHLNFLLIGRYNAWKGQLLLLEAIANLAHSEQQKMRVKLVGSVFGEQVHYRDAIITSIATNRLEPIVELVGFDADPTKFYEWADVVVVPSTNPEPFGLVAIEAMAARRAVIAADHGGLSEIVIDRTTGLKVCPDDARALADAIRTYLERPEQAHMHGQAGYARFTEHFDESRYIMKIADAVQHAVDPKWSDNA